MGVLGESNQAIEPGVDGDPMGVLEISRPSNHAGQTFRSQITCSKNLDTDSPDSGSASDSGSESESAGGCGSRVSSGNDVVIII